MRDHDQDPLFSFTSSELGGVDDHMINLLDFHVVAHWRCRLRSLLELSSSSIKMPAILMIEWGPLLKAFIFNGLKMPSYSWGCCGPSGLSQQSTTGCWYESASLVQWHLVILVLNADLQDGVFIDEESRFQGWNKLHPASPQDGLLLCSSTSLEWVLDWRSCCLVVTPKWWFGLRHTKPWTGMHGFPAKC